MHLAMASTRTVEATAEEAKSLSKTESCDRKPVIDLQTYETHLHASLANRSHVYFAEGMPRQITYKYTYLYEYSSFRDNLYIISGSLSRQGTGTLTGQ